MKIVIIDDDKFVRESICMLFERQGHTVFLYEKSDGAIAFVENINPDITLTDHNLGEGDKGLKIAGDLINKGRRAILMSGDNSIETSAWSISVPFVDKVRISDRLEWIEKLARI